MKERNEADAQRVTALKTAIREMGLNLDVQPDGMLAVLVPASGAEALALNDGAVRARVMKAARDAGFTHAAIELLPQQSREASASESMRLFIALELNGATQEKIHRSVVDKLRQRHPGASWVRRENLHLTLKFLGDTPAHGVSRIEQALRDELARVPAFQLVLSRVGAFPDLDRPRVIWLGARGDGKARCDSLAALVDSTCSTLGFARETRRYSAHVTLARVRRPRAGGADGMQTSGGSRGSRHGEFAEAARSITGAWSIRVDHASLMRSELSREGSRYTTLARIPLGVG